MLFEGNRLSTEAFLRSITGQYYVYVLCRPDGRPFYVGKGLNKRALDHEAEARRNHPIGESNPFKCNVIRKIVRDGGEVIYRIDAAFTALYQQDCLEHEALLIKRHGRLHEGGGSQIWPAVSAICLALHRSASSATQAPFQASPMIIPRARR